MRFDRTFMKFAPHSDRYKFVSGIGYVATDKAPKEARDAIKLYNSYTFPTKNEKKAV